MPPRRTQQHKPQRDAAKARELAALKQENKHLKRQLARLRRLVEKLQGVEHMGPPEEENEAEPIVDSSSDATCPNCKNQLIEVITPTKVIVGCPNCKWSAGKGRGA